MKRDRKIVLKLIIIGLVLCTALFFICKKYLSGSGKWAKDIPVLMYHHLLEEEENPYEGNSGFTCGNLSKHMASCIKGYYTVGLDELEKFVREKLICLNEACSSLLMTGISNCEYAYPILKNTVWRRFSYFGLE